MRRAIAGHWDGPSLENHAVPSNDTTTQRNLSNRVSEIFRQSRCGGYDLTVSFMESNGRIVDVCLETAREVFFAPLARIVIKPLPSARIDDVPIKSGSFREKLRDAIVALAMRVLCTRQAKHFKWKIGSGMRDSCCRCTCFYSRFVLRLI